MKSGVGTVGVVLETLFGVCVVIDAVPAEHMWKVLRVRQKPNLDDQLEVLLQRRLLKTDEMVAKYIRNYRHHLPNL